VNRREPKLLAISGLAWSAGLIHLEAAADHFEEYVPYAVCFVALALLQIIWGVAVSRRPSPGLLRAGIAGSLAVIAVWVLSRTAGLPFGPDLHAPEAVGILDAIATIDETMLCVLASLTLRPTIDRRRLYAALQATGVLMILFSSLMLGGGIHAH
jgi:predicted branched-subunit amino acid permease